MVLLYIQLIGFSWPRVRVTPGWLMPLVVVEMLSTTLVCNLLFPSHYKWGAEPVYKGNGQWQLLLVLWGFGSPEQLLAKIYPRAFAKCHLWGLQFPLMVQLPRWTIRTGSTLTTSWLVFTYGFHIRFDHSGNIHCPNPSMVLEYLSCEVLLHRMCKLPVEVFSKGIHVSPIGLISKKNRPGKWCMIIALFCILKMNS